MLELYSMYLRGFSYCFWGDIKFKLIFSTEVLLFLVIYFVNFGLGDSRRCVCDHWWQWSRRGKFGVARQKWQNASTVLQSSSQQIPL